MKLPSISQKGLFTMKHFAKALALVLVLSMVCMVFASCGTTLSGEYKNALTGTYKFSGSKVTYTTLLGSVEGTYKITKNSDGKQVIIFEFEDSIAGIVANGQEIPFEKTDAGIKISGVEYKKQ